MKARLALLVAAGQILVLSFMAGQREWIMRHGAPITLRTAPVDPNDVMRGAYVHLDYDITIAPAALCQGGPAKWVKSTDYLEHQALRDRVVYAALKVNEHGLAGLASLSDAPPAGGLFLRGRVQTADAGGVHVRYGIEAIFMGKAAATKTEALARGGKAGAPMDVSVAVSPSGIAVLKDYTWEPLGLTIAFDRPSPRDQTRRWQPQPLTGLTITLHNYGERDLAIVDLPGAASFRLVPNERVTGMHYQWARDNLREQPVPEPGNIIVLKPGATHQVHLDLTQPQWWVTDTNKPAGGPLPLQKVTDGWSASFRIEYAPPRPDSVLGLPHADLIRHAPLRSRAFNANQGID